MSAHVHPGSHEHYQPRVQSEYGEYAHSGVDCPFYETTSIIEDTGGSALAGDGLFAVKDCAPENAGLTISRDESSGTSYGLRGGVLISSLIGINLSFDASWTRSYDVTFHFPARSEWCGDSGYPTTASHVREG